MIGAVVHPSRRRALGMEEARRRKSGFPSDGFIEHAHVQDLAVHSLFADLDLPEPRANRRRACEEHRSDRQAQQ